MKKILLALPVILLLAAGCSSSPTSQSTTSQAQPTPTEQQVAPTPTPTAIQASPTPSPTAQANNYLAVNEWGVEFQKPTGMTDLEYAVSAQDSNSVGFTTQQVVSLGGKNCTVDQAPLGTLSRTSNFNAWTQDGRPLPTNVKIGNYYYFYTHPQATCSNNAQGENLESTQASALTVVILKTLKLGSN